MSLAQSASPGPSESPLPARGRGGAAGACLTRSQECTGCCVKPSFWERAHSLGLSEAHGLLSVCLGPGDLEPVLQECRREARCGLQKVRQLHVNPGGGRWTWSPPTSPPPGGPPDLPCVAAWGRHLVLWLRPGLPFSEQD